MGLVELEVVNLLYGEVEGCEMFLELSAHLWVEVEGLKRIGYFL